MMEQEKKKGSCIAVPREGLAKAYVAPDINKIATSIIADSEDSMPDFGLKELVLKASSSSGIQPGGCYTFDCGVCIELPNKAFKLGFKPTESLLRSGIQVRGSHHENGRITITLVNLGHSGFDVKRGEGVVSVCVEPAYWFDIHTVKINEKEQV